MSRTVRKHTLNNSQRRQITDAEWERKFQARYGESIRAYYSPDPEFQPIGSCAALAFEAMIGRGRARRVPGHGGAE